MECLIVDGYGQVHFQVLVDDDADLVLMLLAQGGEANTRNIQGRTALNLAEAKKRCRKHSAPPLN